nr:hypothetical protein B0A51_05263 [Rachicladosporium sp. CCFEE 5018]
MTDKVVVTEGRFTDVAHRLIGKGGEGEAHLAIRYNHQTHQIVDRFVSKDTQRWLIDVRDPWWVQDNCGVYLPMEIMAMKTLASTALPKCKHFVGVRGWHSDIEQGLYRIHTEFCPYGDLSQVVKLFADLTENIHENGVAEDENEIAHIPEPALWYILEALCDAGLTMEFGACNGTRDPEWEKILHRDIKPKNIFLSEPSESYPHYPTPKLGDFGLAIFETDADHQDFYAEGSEGFRSPEQLVHSPIGDGDSSEEGSEYGSDLKRRQAELDSKDTKTKIEEGDDTKMKDEEDGKDEDDKMETDSNASDDSWMPMAEAPDSGVPIFLNSRGTLKRPKLTMATNVFNVGICIMNMMNQHSNATAILDWESALNDGTPQFSDAAVAKYSRVLMRTVRACVRYRPSDRCTFTDLKARINRHTAGPTPLGFVSQPYEWKYNRAESMRRNGAPMKVATLHDIGRFYDPYAIGAQFDPEIFEAEEGLLGAQ